MDNLLELADLIELLSKPFSRQGRRELMGCFLLFAAMMIVALSAFYLVYGRGPDCHVVAKDSGRSRSPEVNWARLSETGAKAINTNCR